MAEHQLVGLAEVAVQSRQSAVFSQYDHETPREPLTPISDDESERCAAYLSCCLSISAPRSLTLIPSPRRSRITVCQRTPRRPFSTWDTYVTSIPDRAASASWVSEARWRKARKARPTARWSLVASSVSVVLSSTARDSVRVAWYFQPGCSCSIQT